MVEGIKQLDLQIVQYLVHTMRSHEWLAVFVYFLADIAILAVIPTLVWLWYRGKPARFRPSGKKAVVLALLTVVFTVAVKTVTAMFIFRDRPFVLDPSLAGSVDSFLDPQSFPSGHVMLVSAVAMSLWLSGYRKVGGILLILAVFVAFGRVAAGVHFTTDVLAGYVLGIFIAWLLHRETNSLKAYLPDV